MSNADRKARKKARRESGYSAETVHEKDPKRPTRKYLTKKQRQAIRRREREVAAQGERMAAAVAKLTRTRKSVDEVMDR